LFWFLQTSSAPFHSGPFLSHHPPPIFSTSALPPILTDMPPLPTFPTNTRHLSPCSFFPFSFFLNAPSPNGVPRPSFLLSPRLTPFLVDLRWLFFASSPDRNVVVHPSKFCVAPFWWGYLIYVLILLASSPGFPSAVSVFSFTIDTHEFFFLLFTPSPPTQPSYHRGFYLPISSLGVHCWPPNVMPDGKFTPPTHCHPRGRTRFFLQISLRGYRLVASRTCFLRQVSFFFLPFSFSMGYVPARL